jgi:GrpB-like predicted nucleotidyltransferase (UPF0157 family)
MVPLANCGHLLSTQTILETRRFVSETFMTLVLPYQTVWPQDFKAIRAYINTGITAYLAVEHIGSTSIPEMTAKPIIDIIIVAKPGCMADLIAQLATLHYRHQGNLGIAGREAFDYLPPHIPLPKHHLYASYPDAAQLMRSIAFRDFLTVNAGYRAQLSELKSRLDAENHSDRTKYMEGKRELVEQIIALGLAGKSGEQ